MGYETRYDLSVTGVANADEIRQQVIDVSGYEYVLEDGCKWYDHESDVRRVSAAHPDALFELSGEGEESGDIWIKYFKGGKMQECRAVIRFDDFDESKLK